MSKLYLDTETCGLHSFVVLIQYAVDDGEIVLYDVWKHPVGETLALIEWFCTHTVVGFNLVFDWFHIVKLYTVFSLCEPDWIPEEHIEEIALLEKPAQDGPCVKPLGALDLLLHSRKGPYQSLMAREDIRIRRVPTALAYALAEALEDRVQLDGILFAKSADKDAARWQVFDIKDRDGNIDHNFKDVCLRFNPAGGLKYLAEHALKREPKYHYKDVEPDPSWFTKKCELGFAPYALAVSSPEQNWEIWKEKDGKRTLVGHAWPAVIHKFINHWATRDDAREYARDDIVYTRELDKHFGCPAPNDDDSTLACMVPVIRWRGFRINVEGMKQLLAQAQAVVASSPVNVNKPAAVRAYLMECLDPAEQLVIDVSTNKKNIEKVAKYEVKVTEVTIGDVLDEDEDDAVLQAAANEEIWEIKEPEHCGKCDGRGHHAGGHCKRCDGRGHMVPGEHPAAVRAKELLAVKAAVKEVELYAKLILAGKFHASFNVVGTLSSRMSGGDGLNAQGIKNSDEVRCMFPLAWAGYILCGGDFDAFEVTLADAVYNDPHLRIALKTGKKIHALFGMVLFDCKYEDIVPPAGVSEAIKKAAKIMYGKAKAGVFAMTYGGDAGTLSRNLNIPMEDAKRAHESWGKSYPGIAKARKRIEKMFSALLQPGGIGTMIVWQEPAEYIETFLGFRRYFTLENKICRALFELAAKPPKAWRDASIKVIRDAKRGRIQTAVGAVASALYGAAFGIQSANQRAAGNHEIQSPGGQITKHVQRAIWDLQPWGIHPLYVAPMNVHDELMCVTHPTFVQRVTAVVSEVVESYRPKVPLIGMTWFENMLNWAEKKEGAEPVKIRHPEMMGH